MFKVDAARAFCNLRVDPADSLKFGIQWQGKLCLDVAIAFGWTLGMALFRLCLDAIAFIMAKQDVKLHCYIDDYVAVVPRVRAEAAFQCLRTLLGDLGLPVNLDKLTPPTKYFTCLGIEVHIEANVLCIASDKLQVFTKNVFWIVRKCISLENNINPFWVSCYIFRSVLSRLAFSLTEFWLYLDLMLLAKEYNLLVSFTKILTGSLIFCHILMALLTFLRILLVTVSLYILTLVSLVWNSMEE